MLEGDRGDWRLDCCTYAIGDRAAHGGDHGDATAVAPADHLFCHRLGGHENTCVLQSVSPNYRIFGPSSLTSNIDLEHHVGIRLCVVESRSLLLDTCCGNQAIEPSLCVTNTLDNCVEALHVSDIDLAVVESVACTACVSLSQWIQFKQINAYQAPQQLVAVL